MFFNRARANSLYLHVGFNAMWRLFIKKCQETIKIISSSTFQRATTEILDVIFGNLFSFPELGITSALQRSAKKVQFPL